MTALIATGMTSIVTLRASSRALDHLALRLHLDGALGAMRLHPVVPLVWRKLKCRLQLGSRELPEGVAIAPAMYMIHRSAALWPDPDLYHHHKASLRISLLRRWITGQSRIMRKCDLCLWGKALPRHADPHARSQQCLCTLRKAQGCFAWCLRIATWATLGSARGISSRTCGKR